MTATDSSASSGAAPRPRRLTDAIIVAALPAIAYAYSYAAERAVARYYGFPQTWITVDLVTVLTTVPAVLSFLIPIALLLVIPPFFLVLLAHPVAVGFFAWHSIWPSSYLTRSAAVIGLALVLGFIALEFLEIRRVWRMTPASQSTELPSIKELYEGYGITLNPLIAYPLGLDPHRDVRLSLLLGLLCIGWMASGSIAAREERARETWLIHTASPHCVHLRNYGDRAICAPVDTLAHAIQPQFYIIPLSTGSTAWRRARLGRLLPATPSSGKQSP